jgi:hypothetical protein
MSWDRLTLRTHLHQALERESWALAAWECGSASFGRADEWSDLDLLVCVEDGKTTDAVRTLEQALGADVRLKWQVPEPTWHGCWQAFYRFRGGSPFFMLDVCISERSKPWKLTERERHGEPGVLFDRIGVARATEIDRAELSKTLRSKFEQLSLTLEMFADFPQKELHRGRHIDAVHWYQQMILGRLVTLLRMRHAPERHDYGARYLNFDLPPEDARRLEALYFIRDAEDLERKAQDALAWARSLIPVLRQGIGAN